MNIRQRFILYFSAIIFLIISTAVYSFWHGLIVNDSFNKITPALSDINKNAKLEKTAQLIRYDDEVLTQSARNYAFTGDAKWKERYNDYVLLLDKRIAEAKQLGDQAEKKFFEDVDTANQALIIMEEQSFRLTDAGNKIEAQAILDSSEYEKQKTIYKQGLDNYLKNRGLVADEANNLSTKTIDSIQTKMDIYSIWETSVLAALILLTIFLLISLYLFITKRLFVPLDLFQKAVKEFIRGNLGETVEIKTHDEVSEFAKDFNQMSRELKESKNNIERKVKERTEELEKLNRFMTGRELKMVELKKEIINLKNQLEKSK